jgi:hypothetical protein
MILVYLSFFSCVIIAISRLYIGWFYIGTGFRFILLICSYLRQMELENQGTPLKAFHPYGTRSPEQLELEAQQQREAEEAKNRQRQLQREERQIR